MFELFIFVLAIENLSDILVNIDLFEKPRQWFESTFPKIGKLARCQYCILFWLCIVFSVIIPAPACLLYGFAAHRLTVISAEFFDRWLNRAPLHVYLQKHKDD